MTDVNGLKDFKCPGWDSMPEIELYMDQVLTLISKHFGMLFNDEDGNMTSSMINNYVKAGVVPSPHKKRYGKEHIACIFMICVLKRVLSISQIGELIARLRAERDIKEAYGLFCFELDRSVLYISSVLSGKPWRSADQTDVSGAELALHCAVSAFANAVISDIILEKKDNKDEK